MSNSNKEISLKKRTQQMFKEQRKNLSKLYQKNYKDRPKKQLVAVIAVLYLALFIVATVLPSPGFFATVIGVFLVLVSLLLAIDASIYFLNLLLIRKFFYLFYLILIGLSLFHGFLDVTDWKILLGFIGTSVFLDLTLFQTPGISKLWTAEFDKGDQTVKKLIERDRFYKHNSAKALIFHKIISERREELIEIVSKVDTTTYHDLLSSYLELYTKEFQLKAYLFELAYDDENQQYLSTIDSFDRMKRIHALTISNDEKKTFVDTLDEGDEVIIKSDLKETIVLMPYFGRDYGYLMSVVGKDEVKANPIDAMYLINLANIMEWHVPR